MSDTETCPTCGKEYKHLSEHLNRNYPSHKPESWPECPSCGERYKSLSNHRGKSDCEFEIEGSERTECGECGGMFVSVLEHYNNYPSHKPDDWPECPECGGRWTSIGLHWYKNPSHEPEITEEQWETAVGLLMGDATLGRNNKTPYLQVIMTTEAYLEYLQSVFGVLGCGVREAKSARESYKESVQGDFLSNPSVENFSDCYRWSTRGHTAFGELAEWYSSGEKVFPKSIDLTPTVLKHWFCGDGSGVQRGGSYHIQIEISNERGNDEKIDSIFSNAGLPTPNLRTFTDNDGTEHFRAVFTVEQSKKLIDYMGEPLPGFKYKWPMEYR